MHQFVFFDRSYEDPVAAGDLRDAVIAAPSQLPCLLQSRAKAQNALLHCRKKADFQSRYADIHTVSVDISPPLIHRHLLEAGNF